MNNELSSEQMNSSAWELAQIRIPPIRFPDRIEIPVIDERIAEIIRQRGDSVNQPQFLATRITPETSDLDPVVLPRKDRENPRQREQKVFTVFFGPQGGRPPNSPAEQIDCSRLAIKSPQEDNLRLIFRVETKRNVTGGTARTQLMYEDGIPEGSGNNRGTLVCNEPDNSLSFRIPGRLLGASDVTVYAMAYSKTGLFAYREFKYKVENPDIIVRLTKIRNNSTKRNWDVRNPFRPSSGLPDIYIITQAFLNTGRPTIDRERRPATSAPPQLGPWDNVPPNGERRPNNTMVYNGEVGLGLELGILAYDHDDYNLALINARLWQHSSAIYCQIEQYCPNAIPQLTAPLHTLMQNAIERGSRDDFMAGADISLRADSDRSASSLVGRNWGLDGTPSRYPRADGYEINMGNVSVWLTFQEAELSWINPEDLI
ncbi:hypothetical protein [Nitrosomonas sp. ANs5]|uniref:hypothetical protein n=1 Tax=Nitrosomonas sp. ANs5 TaxID=3423941 RepID=UPI003D32DE45